MAGGAARIVKRVYQFELYEVVGLVALLITLSVFLSDAGRFQAIIGFDGVSWSVLNDLVGMFQSGLTWLIVAALCGMTALYAALRVSKRASFQQAAYLFRVLITFCVMLAIYKVVNFYTEVFNPFDRDISLQHIDKFLFLGKLPSEWLQAVTWRPLTDILSIAYLSWFGLTYATILLLLKAGRHAVNEYVLTCMMTFYVGYMTYLFVPAIGPMFTFPFSHPIGGISFLFDNLQFHIARDCFPSLHTAISLVMLHYIWRFRRKYTSLYLPIALLIIFSTVYLRFHYGIDVVAGAALAGTTTQLGPILFAFWDRRRAMMRPARVLSRAARDSGTDVSD